MRYFRKGLMLLALTLSAGALASCDFLKPSEEEAPQRGDKNWVEYVDDENVQLSLDYKNHDFYKDGIGEVTLKTPIDGDTAHFYPVVTTTSRDPIKSRFWGIDTPESTGRIQPWGQAASKFTKQKLNNAKENGTIVVSTASSKYGAPVPDSTGDRYVSLIWINETKKNADFTELKLLNLWIVQEGYSWVKNVADMPSYSDIFYEAEAQAKKYKLYLFSDKDDPDYPPEGEYTVVTILDLKREREQLIKNPNYESKYDGLRVCITGTVAGYADGTLYLEDYYSEEQGGNVKNGYEYAGINCFCGMTAVTSIYTEVNTYLKVYGYAKNDENFGFQITGLEGHFKTVPSLAKMGDVEILASAEDNQDQHKLEYLKYSKSQLNTVASTASFECFNCAVEVTDKVKVNNVYVNNDGDITLYFENASFTGYISGYKYKGNPDNPQEIWNTKEQFMGKEFLISGVYTVYEGASLRWEIVVPKSSNLVWVRS